MTDAPASAAASSPHAAASGAAGSSGSSGVVTGPRDTFAWVGPLLATAVTLPLVCYARLIVILGAGGAEDTGGLSASVPIGLFHFGLLLPLGLLAAAWALVGDRHDSNRRILYSFFAPVSVLLVSVAALVLAGI